MDVSEAVQLRRSIREFLADDNVADADVQALVEAARAAPSAGNRMAWHLYVIRDDELRARLATESANQPFIGTAPVVFVFTAEPELNQDRYGQRGLELYCLQDVAAAVENVLLVATELGLGACWCGGFDEAKATEILRLPEGSRPVAIVPIGKPRDDLPDPRPRRSIKELVTYL